MPRFLPLFLLVLLLGGCGSSKPDKSAAPGLRTGPWRMALYVHGEELPFLFELAKDSAGYTLTLQNADERILVKDIVLTHDTVRIRMPLFDSEFRGRLQGDSVLRGHWYNYLKGPDYRVPFMAKAGDQARFQGDGSLSARVAGQWESHFSPGTPDAYDALGIFHQQEGRVTGTFGTETGDYRYLEGALDADSLKLSSFDGSHAFLFKAVLRNDSLIGRYWSGIHWQEPWVAVRNPSFHLRDPDSLTFLKEGHDMVDFTFPTIDGGSVSPNDAKRAGHVRMIQVMGSWCPNCVDETKLLQELYSAYHDDGLEVVAIAFEKYEDRTKALKALQRFRDELEVDYPIAYAGMANKENTAAQLPFLDHVMGYPTCIFIDKAGKVRRIRTGFYGPGTGEHYLNYKRNLETFVQQLLAEPS